MHPLRDWLEAIGYDTALRAALGSAYFVYPSWYAADTIQARLRSIDPALRLAFSLLLLKRDVPFTRVKRYMPADVLDALCGSGLTSQHRGRVSLVPHLGLACLGGKYLWVDLPLPGAPAPTQRAYLGLDSYLFARHLRPLDGNALELGTGAGLLALAVSDYATHVTATDIDAEALRLASFNVAMNGLNDRVTVRESDLFSALPSQRFRFICASLPSIPLPRGISLGVWAGGGEDGLDLVGRMLDELPEHLEPSGRGQILTTTPVTRDRYRPLDLLIDRVLRAGMDCTVQRLSKQSIRHLVQSRTSEIIASTPRERSVLARLWMAHLRDRRYTSLDTLLLTVDRPASAANEGRLRVTGLLSPPSESGRPVLFRRVGRALADLVDEAEPHA